MNLRILLILSFFIISCAPKDKPLSREDNDKIKESAFYGSSSDVITYGAYRVLDVKRILEIALKWEKIDIEKLKDLKLDLKPGFNLIKSCGQGSKGAYLDLIKYESHFIEFDIGFENCSVQSNFSLSAKVYGFENFKIELIEVEGKIKVNRVFYSTNNFNHLLTPNDKHPRFSNSGLTGISEKKMAEITLRTNGEYRFKYESNGKYEQEMLSENFRVKEDGEHYIFTEGNFIVDKAKVTNVILGGIKLTHKAPREVHLKRGRHLFNNEKNRLSFFANFGMSGLEFAKDCGFLKGSLSNVSFNNGNEKRNRFFEEVEELKEETFIFDYIMNKGRDAELVQINDKEGVLLKSQPAKCFIKNSNLSELAQPKIPFEYIFQK
ncbi:MAG: hypothetical protein KDD58_00995 [Bdellovibrionales bacterium]|nr:hypothetical protein [Bdellovibrionales bacterium]